MKLKTVEIDGKTYAELDNGLPIYVDDKGKESPLDAASMHDTVKSLNHEAMTRRKEADSLKEQLSAFEGLDAAKAREALQTIQNIDSKKLIDAGEVDRVRKEISDSFQSKLDAEKETNQQLRTKYATEKLTTSFAGSKFIKDKLAIPADIVQDAFSRNFKLEDGVHVPVDANGNTIYSKSNPGQVASFDEAIELIVDQYPNKESIMRGSGHNGSGSGPVDGGGGNKSIKRSAFNAMTPEAQHKAVTKDGMTIVD